MACAETLSFDIRLLAANVFLKLEQGHRQSDIIFEVVLRGDADLISVTLVLLNVETDRGTTAASARQTNDNAAAVVKLDIQALVLGHAAVKIGVGKVASVSHLAAGDGAADKVLVRHLLGQVGNQFVGPVALNTLVIVSREKRAAVDLPELVLNRRDAGGLAALCLGHAGNNVQPGNNGPDAVLLANMVASRAETLLAANGHLLVVKQVAEELPAGWDFVVLQTLGLGDKVHSPGSGHRSCKTIDTLLLEPRNELGVVGNNGQAVTGRNEGVGTVDHVAVAITVTSSAEVNPVLIHGLHELMSINQIRIRVATCKVRLRRAVHGAAGGQTEFLDEDVDTVRARHAMHAVKQDLEVFVAAQELLDQIKVEDLLHHGHIVCGGMYDLDLQWAVGLGTNRSGVDIGDISDVVGGQRLGHVEDLVGDGLGSGSAIGQVVLDSKVGVGSCITSDHTVHSSSDKLTTRIMARRQQNTTSSLPHADQVTRRRSTQDTILANEDLLDPIGSSNLGDLLNDLGVVVAAIARDDQESALSTFGDRQEDAGDEGFGVVGLLEDLDLLAQTRAGKESEEL